LLTNYRNIVPGLFVAYVYALFEHEFNSVWVDFFGWLNAGAYGFSAFRRIFVEVSFSNLASETVFNAEK